MNIRDAFCQMADIWMFNVRRKAVSWKLLVSMAVLAMVLGFSFMTAYANRSMGGIIDDFVNPFLGSAPLALSFVAVIMSFDVVSEEFDNKTAYTMLTKPVDRFVFLSGKMLSSITLVVFAVIVYFTVVFMSCISIYGHEPDSLPVSFAISLLYGLACVSISTMISTITRRNSVSIVASMGILVAMSLVMPGTISRTLSFEPWFSLSYCSESILHCGTGVHSIYHIADNAMAASSLVPETSLSVAVMAAYFIIPTVASMILFDRRR